MPWLSTTPAAIADYIRQQAGLRGIEPETAVAVARSEGLNNPVGDYGQSFGPYQLYIGGGLGNSFLAQTGLRPQDYETNWRTQVQWVLNWVTTHGWNPGGIGLGTSYQGGTGGGFHGASATGISNWQGLSGSFAIPLGQETDGDGGGTEPTPSQPTPSQPSNGQAPTPNTSGIGGRTTSAELSFADSIQHVLAQGSFVLIGLVLLLGGIYLIGRR